MSEVLKLDISAVSNLHPPHQHSHIHERGPQTGHLRCKYLVTYTLLTNIPTYMSEVLKLDISAVSNLHPPHQHPHIHERGPQTGHLRCKYLVTYTHLTNIPTYMSEVLKLDISAVSTL